MANFQTVRKCCEILRCIPQPHPAVLRARLLRLVRDNTMSGYNNTVSGAQVRGLAVVAAVPGHPLARQELPHHRLLHPRLGRGVSHPQEVSTQAGGVSCK